MILKKFKKVIVSLFELECLISKKLVAGAHKRLYYSSWGITQNPEFFDHQIDLFYKWQKTRSAFWLERGIFSSLSLKRGGEALELACGDGFNARNFYSNLVKNIIACDFDRDAINTAKRKNKAINLQYILADIRTDMPDGSFDNIIWDAAIEHFTPEEINKIMNDIKNRLKDGGILSGYTIVEQENGKSLEQHEYEFKSKEDLERFFTPVFKNVIVFETLYPERHNLYFWASDGEIPFSDGWKNWLTSDKRGVSR